MAEAAFLYYLGAAAYTAAMTAAMPLRVRWVRAALLWPVFWGYLTWRCLRGRHGRP